MIRDRSDLNKAVAHIAGRGGASDFKTRMADGKAKAAAARASSTAPPSPAPSKSKNTTIPQTTKAAGNASPVAKMPAPATKRSTNAKGGTPTAATRHSITINIK